MKQVEDDLSLVIQQANQHLKEQQCSLLIERRNQKLCLRGTLPPKQESKRQAWYQQRIPLAVAVDESGVMEGADAAIAISKLVAGDEFSWAVVAGLPQVAMKPKQRDRVVVKFNHLDLSNAVVERFGGKQEVKLGRSRRIDVIDGTVISEVKTGSAHARDVGQLFEYMSGAEVQQGRIIAESFGVDAIELVEVLNLSGYHIELYCYEVPLATKDL